ncbi:hypothetical protein KAR28_03560 [Candidatus Parcubacteria bacterium]|nr:hypothetical protein [Candidatus Parcubacteria bacterium]
MFNKKRIIWFFVIFFVLGFVGYFGVGVFDYLEIVKIEKAIAGGGCPGMDGGRISLVREPCILDTPASNPTTCGISCPMATTAWGPACVNYIEVNTTGQLGTIFLTPPIGFVYSGGGTHPTAGMDFLYCGASNAIPWVIGIPGVAASRTKKLVDTFKFIVAGFKD